MENKGNLILIIATIIIAGGIVIYSQWGNWFGKTPAPVEKPAPTVVTPVDTVYTVTAASFSEKAPYELVIPEGIANVAVENGNVVIKGVQVADTVANTLTTKKHIVAKAALTGKKEIKIDASGKEGIAYSQGTKKFYILTATESGKTKGYKASVNKEGKLVVTPPPAPTAPKKK